MNSKADYIAEKYGFAKGVATSAYLLAFDSAVAKCDPRYGWKRGTGGKCERVQPKDDPIKQMQDYYDEVDEAANEGKYKNDFGTDSYIPLGTQKFIKSRTLQEENVQTLLGSKKLSKEQKVDLLHDVATGDMSSDEAKDEALRHWKTVSETGKPPLNAFGTTDFISSAKNSKDPRNSEEYGMKYWGVPSTKAAAEGMDDWEFDLEDLGWSNFIRFQRDQQRATISSTWGRYNAGKRGISEMEGDTVYSVYKPEYADPKRRDSAAKCDPRYGWKRGTGGKCERVKLKQEQGSPVKRGGNGRNTLLAVGGSALAIGAVGGVIGGMAIANGEARKQMNLEREEINATIKESVDKQVAEKESVLVEENGQLRKAAAEQEQVIRDLGTKVAQNEESVEAIKKEAQGVANKASSTEKEWSKTQQELAKVTQSLKEKEAEAGQLKEKYSEIESAPERLRELTIELDTEKGRSETLAAKVADQENLAADAKAEAEQANERLTVSTEALKQTQSALNEEKTKFESLGKEISTSNRDLRSLTQKVKALKDVQVKAGEDEKKLVVAKEAIATLEITTRNLNTQIGTLQEERTATSAKLKQATAVIEALQSSTTVDQETKATEIKKLNAAVDDGARQIKSMREAEAKAKDELLQANRQLVDEQKRANELQKASLEKGEKLQSLEKELGVTREQSKKEAEAIHERYKSELAKAYEEKAEILSASPDTFSQKKLRRSSDAQLSGLVTYSIDGGISEDSLRPDSPLWTARPDLREKAVRKATDRIVDLEEERIQAEVAKTMVKTIKDAPLAMSRLGGEREIANMRKRTSDLAEATALARTIAEPSNLIETGNGLPMSRRQQWKSMAKDIWEPWNPDISDSPTPQLLENEAILAEAKLRDVYVFSQSKKIRKEAQSVYKEILSSSLPPKDKAEQMKSAHRSMLMAIKEISETATGSRDDLFAAVKKNIEGRRDSIKDTKVDAKKKGRLSAEKEIRKALLNSELH